MTDEYPTIFSFHANLSELSFFTRRGSRLFVGGGRTILGGLREDQFFFHWFKGGGPEFFHEVKRGGGIEGSLILKGWSHNFFHFVRRGKAVFLVW